MVYKKKLSKLNIDILKSLHNKVTSPDIDDSLTMTLQYIPSSEDTFMSELFAEQLNDKFYNESYEYDNKKLRFLSSESNNGNNKNINRIISIHVM